MKPDDRVKQHTHANVNQGGKLNPSDFDLVIPAQPKLRALAEVLRVGNDGEEQTIVNVTRVDGGTDSNALVIEGGSAPSGSGTGNLLLNSADALGGGGAGNVEVNAGDAEDGGAGGTVEVFGGDATGGGGGGDINLTAGDADGSGAAGDVTIEAGYGADDAHNGSVDIRAGGGPVDINLDGTTGIVSITTGGSFGTTGEFLGSDGAGGLMYAVPSGSGGAPTTADYLVGTSQAGLSAEIVVGTTPGGELGGTWGSPTVDATHSGSSHAATQAAAEATAAVALAAHVALWGGGPILISDTPAGSPLVFDDLLQNDDGTDLLYADGW